MSCCARWMIKRRIAVAIVAVVGVGWAIASAADDKQSGSTKEITEPSSGPASKDAATAAPKVGSAAKEGESGSGGFGGGWGGFGGGGFGGGAGVGGGAPLAGGQDNWVQSGQVVLAVSKSGKTLFGYSVRTGTWDKVRLESL